MRRICTLLIFCPFFVSAQPAGYYNSALGLNGAALRDTLHAIIANHNAVGYAALWNYYPQTDAKPNGKVWDIYSDNPGQTPPYEYNFGTDQCGNYNSEGDCYNREHTYPQSYFNSAEPVKSDLFQVYPTDGYVNGKRGNLMYGEVGSPDYTSQNGSETGTNIYPGSPAGNAFEPIDSFKGDLARTYFYIATRYKGEDNGWSNWDMANGAELKQWAVNMLLDWHQNDPVSQKETDRNNAIYSIQNNRNPFIDYPQFADCIWGTGNCANLFIPAMKDTMRLRVYPNPASNEFHISLNDNRKTSVYIFSAQGRLIWSKENSLSLQENIATASWAKGLYFLKLVNDHRTVTEKLIVQ